jgi:hypothetical protein
MKRIICSPLLVGILVFYIALIGCKKEDVVEPVALANTTWKMTKSIWTFSNGNIQTFEPQSNLDGVVTWFFLNNQDVNVLYEPYTTEENGTWTRVNDKITMTFSSNGTNHIRNYKILELTDTFLKVDFEEQNGESSENGRATKMIFEFKKQ